MIRQARAGVTDTFPEEELVIDAELPLPAGDLPPGTRRGDALELLGRANATWSSPEGALLRELLAAVADEPDLLAHLRQQAGASAVDAAWAAALDRAVTRGEAPAQATHPRVVSLPMILLRGEYLLRGTPVVPDDVITEIVDEVFLPLVRGRSTRSG